MAGPAVSQLIWRRFGGNVNQLLIAKVMNDLHFDLGASVLFCQ